MPKNIPGYLKPAPESFSGFCPVAPVPKGRPRFNSKTHTTYTPTATRNYETAVRKWLVAKYGRDTMPMDGPLFARYEFILEKPKSAPKKKVYSDTKPDIDNFVKAFQDAMDFKSRAGDVALGVIANDSRVACLETSKRYAAEGEQPGTAFHISQVLSEMMIFSPNLTETMRAAFSRSIPQMEWTQLESMKPNKDATHIYLVLAGEQQEAVESAAALVEQKFPNAAKLSVI